MKDKHAPRIRSARSIRATGGFRDLTDSNPRIAYWSRPDTTSEPEAEIIAAVYHFIIFEGHEGIAAAPTSTDKDPEEERSAR